MWCIVEEEAISPTSPWKPEMIDLKLITEKNCHLKITILTTVL